jgi:hypothetical protein
MSVAAGTLVRPSLPVGWTRVLGAAVAAWLVAASIGQVVRSADAPAPARPPAAAPGEGAVAESLDGLPMAWVANAGQTDPAVRYLAQGMGYSTFLTDSEAVVRLDGAVVRLGFDGAASAPAVSTEQPLAATVSSFAGSDPSRWQSGAPTAAVVRYTEAWPGVDLTFRGRGSELEWDLHVAVGADPAVAGMAVTGADRIEVDGDRASLVVGDRELPLSIPAVWQTRPDGSRLERRAVWDLDDDVLRVLPVAWDPDLPGVIDPTLEWSTYLGGGVAGDGNDSAAGIALDDLGAVYVTGATYAMDFPTTAGAYDTSLDESGTDVFVSKLTADGSALAFSTLLGGSGEDRSVGLAVDDAGQAYVTGNTSDAATDFPTTSGAFDTTLDGANDVFVTKLDSTGGALLYSTLVGGSGGDLTGDRAGGVALDDDGHAYVTGFTHTPDFPTTAGAFDTVRDGISDVFVIKLDPAGSALVYGTLLGGSSSEEGHAIAVDGDGHAYLAGRTLDGTTDYPTTPGAADTTHNGTWDAYTTKLDPTGGALSYSTLLGGSANDLAAGIAVAASGQAYVTGVTASVATTQFPTTPGAFDTTANGSDDAFVTSLDAPGATLVYSTRLGGSQADAGRAITVDATGHAHVAGRTVDGSTDFPTTPGAFDTTPGGTDAFATKLDPTGSALAYSTLLGGAASVEVPNALAVGPAGDVYLAGSTGSSLSVGNDFPTTPGALDTSPSANSTDAFVTMLDPTGGALGFSTVLGGSRGLGNDEVTALAADATGIYFAGPSLYGNFPTTPGAYDTTPNGSDVVIGKLDPTGTTLLYSTFIGNHGNPEEIRDLAVDDEGNAYVVGTTYDALVAYPTTPGAFDTTHNGLTDAFLTKLDATGTALVYSTFLGGVGSDDGWGVAVDGDGRAHVTGTAGSGTGFPATAGAFDTTASATDAFVAKVEPDGGSLAYATFLGGSSTDQGRDVALDASGNAYVTGSTYLGLTAFPTTPGAFDTTHNGGGDLSEELPGEDVFVTKLNPAGSALTYSTYLGSSYQDRGAAIAVDAAGSAYVTGSTGYTFSSEDPPVELPTTPGAFDTTFNGGLADAFVTKLSATGGALAYSTFLGSEGDEYGSAIAVDADGFAYVVGATGANSVGGAPFPTTADALDPSRDQWDAFVTQVDDSGAELVYSSFLGGSRDDMGQALALAGDGRVAVGGRTQSTDLSVTPGAYDTSLPVNADAGFLSVFDLSLSPPVTPSGCNNTTVLGATVSWYPANPGAQSALKVACTFGNNPGSSQVSPSFTVHDANVVQYHNGAGRRVTNQAVVPSGATSIQMSTASNGIAGLTAWVNRPISGPGIAPRTFVRQISGTGLATLSQATVAAVGAGQTYTVENGSARILDDAAGAPASTTLTSASAGFTAADVGLSISGTGIEGGTTIDSVTSATEVELSEPATLAGPIVTLGATLVTSTTRQLTGASTTSTTRISSPAAAWKASDVGLRVSGRCTTGPSEQYNLPANVYVVSIVSGSIAVTTGGLLANWSSCNLTVGDPSATAPQTGEVVGQQVMQLDLHPALVPDAGECASAQPGAHALTVSWRNPGSFQGAGLSHEQPGLTGGTPTRAIGQLVFTSGAMSFSAFVLERGGFAPGDPIWDPHYDLQLPFVPWTTAMCPGSSTSPGLGFALTLQAVTASQAALPVGVGRPGTNQVRAIRTSATGGYTTTAYVRSDTGITFTPGTAFQRLCVYPTGSANAVDFGCGNG